MTMDVLQQPVRHILFVLHSLSAGGAERVVSLLANHWVAAGRQVSIATFAPVSRDHYSLDPAVARLQMAPEALAARGMAANLRRLRALRHTLQRLRPDVAVAMMDSTNVLLALARSGCAVPVCIGSERVHPPRHSISPPWAWLRRMLYGRLDAIVAQTATTAAWLRENTSAARVAVIPNPVVAPAEVGEPRRRSADVLAHRPFVLGAGRLQRQKGFDLLIQAFAAIAERHPDHNLVILGDGTERPALRRLADDLGIGARVFLPGNVADVGQWYRAAEVYVLSSRFEGFPNVLLEAMAHGCAVVVADCEAGPRDIVTDGRDGLLVPPHETEPLARTLSRLLDDADRRAELGRQAQATCGRFSLPRVAALWDGLFNEVLH
jgi:glycosyltransferase involved in cell wall biosynthesis